MKNRRRVTRQELEVGKLLMDQAIAHLNSTSAMLGMLSEKCARVHELERMKTPRRIGVIKNG